MNKEGEKELWDYGREEGFGDIKKILLSTDTAVVRDRAVIWMDRGFICYYKSWTHTQHRKSSSIS